MRTSASGPLVIQNLSPAVRIEAKDLRQRRRLQKLEQKERGKPRQRTEKIPLLPVLFPLFRPQFHTHHITPAPRLTHSKSSYLLPAQQPRKVFLLLRGGAVASELVDAEVGADDSERQQSVSEC
jgi:hypothetical protein